MQDAAKAAGAAEERVWVYLFEIPAEYGRVLASVKYGADRFALLRSRVSRQNRSALSPGPACDFQIRWCN
jgi:hypothetical protein